MLSEQVQQVEAGVRRIAARTPGTVVTDTMILRITTLLGRGLSARLEEHLKPTGLSELEFRALLSLYSHDGTVHPGDLCVSLAQSPANLTRVSDNLFERDLITRELSDQDRRRMVMRITRAGEKLVRALLPQMSAFTRELFKQFPERDRARLLADLKRLVLALDSMAGKGSVAA
jgi:MarR family transcriptional regulator, negative regulator of the multidrug operon emrRAB